MTAIYSRRLASQLGAGSTSFAVPANQTAVIRTIALCNTSGSAADGAVQINPTGLYLFNGAVAAFPGSPTAPNQIILDCHVALAAGESVACYGNAGLSVIASGYLFAT